MDMIKKLKRYIAQNTMRVAAGAVLAAGLLIFIGIKMQAYHVWDANAGSYDWNLTLLGLTLILAFLATVSVIFPVKLFLGRRAQTVVGNIYYFALPFVLVYVCEMMYETSMFHMGLWKIYMVNVAIYYIVFLMVRAFFIRRVGIAAILASSICYIFTFICICVLHFRGTPFMPVDIFAARTAMAVADRYVLALSDDMVFGIVLAVFIVVFSLNFAGKSEGPVFGSRWKGAVCRICLGLFSVCIAFWFGMVSPIQALGYDFKLVNQAQYVNYWYYGTAAAFCENIKHSIMQSPEGFSDFSIEEMGIAYPGVAGTDERPNIIVVMNESFCDYSMWGSNIGLEGGCAPYFEELYENSIHGELLVSTMGGGTCNTEFEVITGNTMYYMPAGSFPYILYMRDEAASAVKYANELQYKTIGMHPAPGSTWNRSAVYPMLGFEETVFIEEFGENPEKRRDLVSDRATYQKVLEIIKEEPEPVFIYDITIQNHSSYLEGAEEVIIELENKEEFPLANNYVNLIRLSDNDLADFIAQLEQLDEDCAVLFFGDHQAGAIETEFEDIVFGFDSDSPVNAKQEQEQYLVHFFMWSNYDDWGAEDKGLVSTNYLLPLLFEQMGLPLTGQQEYLLELYESIPAINACGIVTSDGRYYSKADVLPDEISSMLKKYESLQYYSMFHRKDSDGLYRILRDRP